MENTHSFRTKNERIATQRNLNNRRQQQALQLHPELRFNRIRTIQRLLESKTQLVENRAGLAGNMKMFMRALEKEVSTLEAHTMQFDRKIHRDGETIRRALSFLRTYGRIAALNFSRVAEEDRSLLVQILGLEYRWCFAAAGTTPEIFKQEIGRTGAR